MKNLAGVPDCDATLMRELTEAGIDLVFHARRAERFSEVPYTVTGELILLAGTFHFRRAWYYWVAEGPVRLELARQMYAVEARRGDVRVAGHCGCPPPDDWARPSEKELRWQLEQSGAGELFGQLEGGRRVESYHIDSQEGLNFFAACLRAGRVEGGAGDA